MATSFVKAAAVQFDPQVGLENKAGNVTRTLEMITEAADSGANLIVLPELANTGYSFSTREDAYAHAEPLDGDTVTQWADLAQQRELYIVGGFAELDDDGIRIFDTAVLVGPKGYIGHYRKAHLWDTEKTVFTPGDTGFRVFDTPIGRIGLLICWDIWHPEVARILALAGADVLCSTNCWVWTPPPVLDEQGRCMASYLTMSASHVNSVPIVAADRVGKEGDAEFLGCSLITGTNGWPASEVAPAEGEAIVYAELDLMESRGAKTWNARNNVFTDRRTDLYDATLGSGEPVHPR